MSIPPLRLALLVGAAGATAPGMAATAQLKLELPALQLSDYKPPYVAVWVEKADQSVAANLAVWYDQKKRNQAGQKWLKDLRIWWRKAGSSLTLPVDGLSSATRGPGTHTLAVGEALSALPPGDYQLVVEVAREHGGHDLVRLPLAWPPKPGTATATARGEAELGAVTLELKP